MSETHARRNSPLLPILDALHATAETGGDSSRSAQAVDEVFIRRHVFFPCVSFDASLNTMFNSGVNTMCNTPCLVQPIITRMHKQMERLYQAGLELKGIGTQAELARALNQSSQTVKNWESRGISMAGMVKAQSAIGCSATWLESGAGPMTHDPAHSTTAAEAIALVPGARLVHASGPDDSTMTQIKKVRLRVQAGITGFQVDPEYHDGETQGVPTKWVLREGLRRDSLLAIVVRGDSMEPGMHDGDTIVVNTADKTLVSGSVYVVNYEGEAVVKRMLRDAGQWWLTSDNSDQRKYHRQLCKGAECIVIGKVIRKESTHI
jgi:phage repressor protein C with HTH and peptisase S24 domain